MVIPRYLCTLLRVMVIFAIFPYSASMSEITPETTEGSTYDVLSSPTCQSIVHFVFVNDIVHDTPVVLISLISHFF